MAEMSPEECRAALQECNERMAQDRAIWERLLNGRRLARQAGEAIEQAYPFGYRSEDREP